ncbi:hypothetical protein R6Q59_034198 [Mikania micrantha]
MASIMMTIEYKYAMNNPSNIIVEVGLFIQESGLAFTIRNWNRASIPANAMFTGRDNDRAIDVLPLIITQALRKEMNPPLNSIPDRIRARLHVIHAFVMTMEYTIPPATVKNSEGMRRFCKQLKAMKRTQKHVAFADTIMKVFQICVWRMELKIPVTECRRLLND